MKAIETAIATGDGRRLAHEQALASSLAEDKAVAGAGADIVDQAHQVQANELLRVVVPALGGASSAQAEPPEKWIFDQSKGALKSKGQGEGDSGRWPDRAVSGSRMRAHPLRGLLRSPAYPCRLRPLGAKASLPRGDGDPLTGCFAG